MRLPRFSLMLGMLAATAVLLAAAPSPTHARDNARDNARDHDHGRRDEVRRAVEAGEIKSLTEILKTVQGKLPGEVAGVEIEHDDGRWRYEFRVVDGKGRLFEVYIDARSGRIERIKEK